MPEPIPRWVPGVKLGLFVVLTVCCVIDLALLGVRLHRIAGPVSGAQFIPELLVTASLTIICCVFFALVLYSATYAPRSGVLGFLTTFIGETIVLGVIYILWIAGVALETSRITCADDDCAMQGGSLAIAWLSWALLTSILMIDVVYGVSNDALHDSLPKLGQDGVEDEELGGQNVQWNIGQFPTNR